jgi:hypothetical protein
MRKAQPACINFILTGYPADESFQRANGHEVAHYFIKPIEIEEMIETIKRNWPLTVPALQIEIDLLSLFRFWVGGKKPLHCGHQFFSGLRFGHLSVCQKPGACGGFLGANHSQEKDFSSG